MLLIGVIRTSTFMNSGKERQDILHANGEPVASTAKRYARAVVWTRMERRGLGQILGENIGGLKHQLSVNLA